MFTGLSQITLKAAGIVPEHGGSRNWLGLVLPNGRFGSKAAVGSDASDIRFQG